MLHLLHALFRVHAFHSECEQRKVFPFSNHCCKCSLLDFTHDAFKKTSLEVRRLERLKKTYQHIRQMYSVSQERMTLTQLLAYEKRQK